MAGADNPIRIADCRGGQNSADSPLALAPTQVASAQNVEWFRATVARKRRGSRLVERTSGASVLPSNKVFTTIAATGRPSNLLTPNPVGVVIESSDPLWYDWGYDTGYDFQSVDAVDTPTTNACLAYFNGKWFAAYKSGVDRLHYLGVNGGNGYRVGLAAPATPGVVKSAGAVTGTRKYRAAVLAQSGGVTHWRSEPSVETSAQALATQRATVGDPGAAPTGEFYTHWELQAADVLDNYNTWWVIGQATATTDIEDNNTSIYGLEPAYELGLFEPPISVKYLQADDNRLLMAGSYENVTDAALNTRVWFTPVLGDMNLGDDQRVPDTASGQQNWIDIDAGDDGGEITGFGPSTLGDVLVFKRTQVWRLTRTGNLDAPYIPRPISKAVGTFGYRTVQSGEDAAGQPCVYFASARGPYRVGVNGVEYLGAPIEDVWARVNQRGNVHLSQHAVYYPDKGQYWLWVSVDGTTVPSVLLVLSVRTGGWAVYTGPIATALCSALLPRFIQEPNKGVTIPLGGPHPAEMAPWVPYCCPNTLGQLVECDAINPSTGVALDTDLETYSGSGSVWSDGTAFAAHVRTGALQPKELDGWLSVTGGAIAGDAASGVAVSVTLIPDFDTSRQRVASTTLTPAGSSTIAVKTIDNCQIADARHMQAQIGDASAVASQWVIHAVQLRVKGAADR